MKRTREAVGMLICGLVLVGCGASAGDDGAKAPSPSQSPADAPVTEPPSPSVATPEPGRLPRPGGDWVNGEWEDGVILGKPLVVGRIGDRREILYAARRPVVNPGERKAVEVTFVATGIRDGSRILRTIPALTPETAPDGIDLYGGDVLGDRGPEERVDDGSYLLLGSVTGDQDVSVTDPDGRSRPVTGSSTEMLPGYTVFFDKAAWDESWSQIELAPLTVTTSDGGSVDVRTRSHTG